MIRIARHIVIILSLLWCPLSSASADDELADSVRQSLARATDFLASISTRGGYVGIYSLDLQQRYGESRQERAQADEIWVQPPGTPSVGKAFLRAYKATGDDRYRTVARDVGRSLAWGQREIGGWDHRVKVGHLQADSVSPRRSGGRCTLDDNITQEALSFLMELDAILDEAWLTESVQLGLKFMRLSQYENGAWPQWYPLRGGYHDHYTFNDNAINDCIRVMLAAHRHYGNPDYLDSARRGGDFIIRSQGAPPQAGWAQQYDRDLRLAWARSFEPPGYCSAATSRNLRSLVDLYLYTGQEKYLEPIPAAIDWLDRSRIGPALWSRLYEVHTNKAIYGDRRDGNKIHYEYDQISALERTSYAWRGEYGIDSAIRYYRDVVKLGPAEFLARRDRPPTDRQRQSRAQALTGRIRNIIAGQDGQGRWRRNNEIYIDDFVRNLNALAEYLEAVRP
ncbi:MAG: hypothetical protein JW810_05670 [Sedimentisphaerales bacterium]|nr:hypothetical protein [Sedimentisphaerales bacterium]